MQVIFLRAYATIPEFINSLFGVDLIPDIPVNTYGFFVAMGFMAAAIVASKELDRRGRLGMIKDIPTIQVVGAKPQWNDFIFPVFVGYFIGMKILGAIIHNPSLLTQGQNTVAYLFSGQGYHIYGAIVGLAAAVYTYYKINKEALPEPKIENTFIQPQDLIGELVMVAAIFGVIGASVF